MNIVESIQEEGALVHFLPPYSPDFQPIEETFSKVKTELILLEEGTDDLVVMLNNYS